MTVGSMDHDGTRWMRCPSCGDSPKNRNKAHLMVDTKGSTYCFKCGYSTQLDFGELIDIALGNKTLDEAVEGAVELAERGGKEQRRFSLLETYEDENPDADAFQMRDQHGKLVGWHVRYPNKHFKNEGDRGIGYLGPWLKSSPSSPITVVEGPYDVVKDRYACMFGTMNAGNLAKFFRMQFVWLFPDPDQVDSEMKRRRFVEKIVMPCLDRMVFVRGVKLAPGDPDEVRDDQIVEMELDAVLQAWGPSEEQARGPIHRVVVMG